MRLITEFELVNRTDVELAVLFHMAAQALASTSPGTLDRRRVISSLQNISRARRKLHKRCTEPVFNL